MDPRRRRDLGRPRPSLGGPALA